MFKHMHFSYNIQNEKIILFETYLRTIKKILEKINSISMNFNHSYFLEEFFQLFLLSLLSFAVLALQLYRLLLHFGEILVISEI